MARLFLLWSGLKSGSHPASRVRLPSQGDPGAIHFHFHRQGPRSRKAAPAAVELCPSAKTPTPKETVCDYFLTQVLSSRLGIAVFVLFLCCGAHYAAGHLAFFGLLLLFPADAR